MTNRLLTKLVVLISLSLSLVKATHSCHLLSSMKVEKDLTYKAKGLNYKHSFVLKPNDDCSYIFDESDVTNNMLYFPKIDAASTKND